MEVIIADAHDLAIFDSAVRWAGDAGISVSGMAVLADASAVPDLIDSTGPLAGISREGLGESRPAPTLILISIIILIISASRHTSSSIKLLILATNIAILANHDTASSSTSLHIAATLSAASASTPEAVGVEGEGEDIGSVDRERSCVDEHVVFGLYEAGWDHVDYECCCLVDYVADLDVLDVGECV